MSNGENLIRSGLALALSMASTSCFAAAPALPASAASMATNQEAVAALAGALTSAIAKVKHNAPALAFQRALMRTIKKSKAPKAVIVAAIKKITLQGSMPAGLMYALNLLQAYYGNSATGGTSTEYTGRDGRLGNTNDGQGNGPSVIGGGSENYGSH